MAKIYSSPKSVKRPNYDFAKFNRDDWQKEEVRYISELRADIKGKGYSGKNSGEIIKFPVADGYAEYMILQMKPLGLIHLEIMDCYQFEYAHLMTAKEVQLKLDQQKRLDEIFARNKKEKENEH